MSAKYDRNLICIARHEQLRSKPMFMKNQMLPAKTPAWTRFPDTLMESILARITTHLEKHDRHDRLEQLTICLSKRKNSEGDEERNEPEQEFEEQNGPMAFHDTHPLAYYV